MSDKKTQKIEVSQKFVTKTGRYQDWEYFETKDEAVEAAKRSTFSSGSEVLVYQAIEKATPNTKDVAMSSLT